MRTNRKAGVGLIDKLDELPVVTDTPEEHQWKEDVLPIIKATRNPRDAALIAVAWDAGARSGELRALTIGDITDYEHGYQITVQEKMGQRTVHHGWTRGSGVASRYVSVFADATGREVARVHGLAPANS